MFDSPPIAGCGTLFTVPDVKREIKLNDLRRYAIYNRTAIAYSDTKGRQARVNRNGIIQIPGIAGAPPYNVEDVLAAAQEFALEPADVKAQGRRLSRDQMAELLARVAPAAAPKDKEE